MTQLRKVALLAIAGVVGVCSLTLTPSQAAEKKKPAEGGDKMTVEDVMEKGFKGKGDKALVNRVIAGTATADEKKTFVQYAEVLAAGKPTKGEVDDDWKKRVGDILTSSKAIAGGDAKASAALKTAVNCKECHTKHKE